MNIAISDELEMTSEVEQTRRDIDNVGVDGDNSSLFWTASRIKEYLSRTKSGSVENSRTNIKFVLDYDPRLMGVFKFNELTQSIWVCRDPGWQCPSNQYEIRDVDLDQLMLYLESEYSLRGATTIESVLNVVSFENSYNPICEFFETSLPEWDGAPHIENLLPDYLGAQKTDLNTAIMKLTMIGAINRAFNPGCKFDSVLILVGSQGIGKSYFISSLAICSDWFSDNLNTVQGDAAFEKLRGVWIGEMAELLATKNAQTVESIKAFITSRVDRYRKKYGRVTESYPRRCIFIGTTNSMQFLQDRSGNRRFLPVLCDGSRASKSMFEDKALFREDILQAWAEAYQIYKCENPELILPPAFSSDLERIRNDFVEDDYMAGLIAEYLRNVKDRSRFVCAKELWEIALGQGDRQPTRKDMRDIGEIMRSNLDGWKFVGRKRCGRYGMQNAIENAHFQADQVAFVSADEEDLPDF